MRLKGALIAAMLLTPAAALAAPGLVTTSISMRAGPGAGFPVVDRIPGGAHVNIHGCVRGDAWCDVSWAGDRGWVSSQYLDYLYRNRYVYLPDYVDVIDVPTVPFVLDSYWSSYYSGRPWYHRRAYWSDYWQSHARFATQIPAERTTRFGRTETRGAFAERQGVTGEERFAREHRAQAVQGQQMQRREGRFANVNGAGRNFRHEVQPMARGNEAAHFAQPNRVAHPNRVAQPSHFAQPSRVGQPQHFAQPSRVGQPQHFAQPNTGHMGRVGGPPMGAHAQMGGPRPGPAAAPHGGGGAPHVNAAPAGGGHTGGGPGGGGGPGRHH
jgi:uncharacterized protein YraI